MSGHRDRFKFETRWATEPLDLLRQIRKLKPTVVHLSGSGANGLVFQTSNGRAQVVTADALGEAFGAAGASVKLVVLRAGYNESHAEVLRAYVDCVVWIDRVHHDAARTFAIGFYGGLGEREPVSAALNQGRAAIRLEGLVDGERSNSPQLKVRDGVDAGKLVLAGC